MNRKLPELIDKLIFYSNYLHNLAKEGEYLLKDSILKQIKLTREYIIEAKDKLKEFKEPEGSKIFTEILNYVEKETNKEKHINDIQYLLNSYPEKDIPQHELISTIELWRKK